jgi:thiol-disulfide isomerase/thioredoxin
MPDLPDGLILVAKRDCETCMLIEPVFGQLAREAAPLTVYTQDDPAFPSAVDGVVDDRELEQSFRLSVHTVPTLIRVREGREVARTFGWDRSEWEQISGVSGLGPNLPATRPGCGSRTEEPGMAVRLAVRFGDVKFQSRRIRVAADADPVEACIERGWSDGLPVVPPTEERVLAMLGGTARAPDEVVGIVPPNYQNCTVEKVAINAVLAGCKPEYLPVVLAAVEAALIPEFGLHGVLATTNFVGPVVMVNGPIGRAIGMNAGGNAFGQGNRANASIGRALQLVVRNVGGGRPGEIDRATLGNPGKYTFCFAEDETNSQWESFAVERGYAPTASTVSVFVGDGVTPIVDELSRTPESLARSFAACLRAVHHPKKVTDVAAFLVVTPEHARVFHEAGWSKARLKTALVGLLQIPVAELARGADGIEAGIPEEQAAGVETIFKFSTGGLNIVRAGGAAGLFSGIISGLGSITINPVTTEIVE